MPATPNLHYALDSRGCYLGRLWDAEQAGPIVVRVSDGQVWDITCQAYPTVRDLFEAENTAVLLTQLSGRPLGAVENFYTDPYADSEQVTPQNASRYRLLAPVDLQAIKACGVTFARSMIERVIEERAGGDPQAAGSIRAQLVVAVGENLSHVQPGSAAAERLRTALQGQGLWSQYLEVGIGPDAEVFTKSQVLSAVGHGDDIGLHPISRWNNPEPEIVLIANSRGEARGATLGNDVNLRDVEGRSALLLGKAKDNNASCAVGPFIRIFDASYGMEDVCQAELTLDVQGPEGFHLQGSSSMREISRSPQDLLAQVCGAHHQYPDGFLLFLGTLFAPVEDRDQPGAGFTHKVGDLVRISNPPLGTLSNRVNWSTACTPWTFGLSALMRNLARRGLL